MGVDPAYENHHPHIPLLAVVFSLIENFPLEIILYGLYVA